MAQYDWETGWQQSQLQFAEDFRTTWVATMEAVSAGTLAANASINLMRGTWGAVINAAISGKNTIGAAVKEIAYHVGKGLAQEAGWRALMAFARAVYAAASRQYARAVKYTAAGAMFTALASIAGGVAAATKPTPARSVAPVAALGGGDAAYGSGYNPSYGGAPAYGPQRVDVHIHMAADGWDAIVRQNDEAVRSGGRAFSEQAAS